MFGFFRNFAGGDSRRSEKNCGGSLPGCGGSLPGCSDSLPKSKKGCGSCSRNMRHLKAGAVFFILILLTICMMISMTGCTGSSADQNVKGASQKAASTNSAKTAEDGKAAANASGKANDSSEKGDSESNSSGKNSSDDSDIFGGENYEKQNETYEARFDKDAYNKFDKDNAAEYNEAVNYAESYSALMPMSRQELYDRLTTDKNSEFSDDAAGYAVNHINVDWKKNALEAAEKYNRTLQLSKLCLYDQLVSESGDCFSPKEAKYAVDNIDADWNENALEAARNYKELLGMSDDEIYDRLIADDGDRFTAKEAQYAIDHL